MNLHNFLSNQSICHDIIDVISDGVYVLDLQRRIVFWNQAAQDISGYKAVEVMGSYCANNILSHVDGAGRALCHGACPVSQCLKDGKSTRASVFLHHKNGHRVPVRVEVYPIREQDRIVGAFEVFRIDSQNCMSTEDYQTLQQKAYIDELTGAWNRYYLIDSIKKRLDQLHRFGWDFTVVFLDIDHFKEVNDNYGHLVGDRVLSMVCQTIRANSRSIDELSRYGGEELVLILPGVHLDWQVKVITEKLRSLVESSFLMDNGRRISVTVSIGATYALPADTVESLLHRADSNMYLAKQAGRNCVRASSHPAVV
jgi:diguanylate cyclase (GGDEF)-like protein/PAS domain S-box-containing protein